MCKAARRCDCRVDCALVVLVTWQDLRMTVMLGRHDSLCAGELLLRGGLGR